MSVDVPLDALPAPETPPAAFAAPEASSTSNDAIQRRATLDGAMSRMARASQDSGAWTETTPMVLHAPAALRGHGDGAALDADGQAAGAPAPAATRG